MSKNICSIYYKINGSDEVQNIKIKTTGRDKTIEAINTLLNYLLSNNETLKKIIGLKWYN